MSLSFPNDYIDILCCAFATAGLGALTYCAYRTFFLEIRFEPVIHKKDYKKDVVYLYQYPRHAEVRSISPFCLKVEAFLRVYKIPHEVVYTFFHYSRFGLMPYIELNGEHIADSEVIEARLREHFNIDDLPKKKEVLAYSLSKMVNNHLFFVLMYYKFFPSRLSMINAILDIMAWPKILRPLAIPVFYVMTFFKGIQRLRGPMGKFKPEEFELLLRKDLTIIRDALGDKKFIMGDFFDACRRQCIRPPWEHGLWASGLFSAGFDRTGVSLKSCNTWAVLGPKFTPMILL
ncbi:unnamed protein product [Caenorhabditis auriculariae]|uniref:Thioredoxin-like fold domain-containing protein n=1 Tax=Caenorhabditis auriculariae TaxID=2777116 RepID=A0A8S1HSG4_9PELO|nr:unnamed protein product [Caenorhabditis auriculariae]